MPGQKKKVGEYVKLSIGTMGVKIMDGMMPIETILMQNLVSWESVDDSKFRLTIKNEKSGKKPTSIDFTTQQGPDICECMLAFAKLLAEERKRQQKAEKQAKKDAAANKDANTGGGGSDNTFEVTQTKWKKHLSGPSKGKKVPEELRLEMSSSALHFMDGYIKVEDILIQELTSWETVSDDQFKIVVKPAKTGGNPVEIVLGTPQARDITEKLLQFAKDLAAVKKQQKAERKRKEKEAAAAAKLAEKLAPRLIAQGKLGEVVTNLYLDTFKEWRDANLPGGVWDCFSYASMAPDSAQTKIVDDVLTSEAERVKAEEPTLLGVLSMAKAGLPALQGMTELCEALAWSRPGAGQSTIMSETEMTILTEAVKGADEASSVGEAEGVETFVETAALMFITAVGNSEDNRKAAVEAGAITLTLGWLDRFLDTPSVCRVVSALLTSLLKGDGAKQLNEDDYAGLTKLVDIIDRSVPKDDQRQHQEELDTKITLYHNPLLTPTVDIIEKLLLCCYRSLATGAGARVKAMELGMVTKLFHIVDAVQSAMLYSRLICGVLNVLLEPLTQEELEALQDDPLAAMEVAEEEEDFEARLGVMMEANLLQVLVVALQHNIPDFAIAGTASLLMRILLSKDHKSSAAAELAESAAVFTDTLERWGARSARSVQPFAVALTIVAVYHMAESPTDKEADNFDEEQINAQERKEKLVEMGTLLAVIKNMKVHKKERMVQEAGFLAIHALTDQLPEDIQEILPEYMGVVEEKKEEEEDALEEGEAEPEPEGEEEALPEGTVSYKVIRKAAVRAAFELDSEQIAILEMDDVIEVFEHKRNENGQVRVRTGAVWDPEEEGGEKRDGWTSITSRDGNKLMVEHKAGDDKVEEEVDPLLIMATDLMNQIFAPLKQFPDDESLAEATLFAAKSMLSEADILKSGVGKGGAMKLIINAADKHAGIPGVAENCFATLSSLVKGQKQNQKKLRQVGGVPVVAKLLENHVGNVKVCKTGMECIKRLCKSGQTLNALNEQGVLETVDELLKKHKDVGGSLRDDGLEVRRKLEDAEKSTPRGGATPKGGPRGRRASISIFGAEPSPRKPSRTDSTDGETDAAAEAEDDAFRELQEFMTSQMFDVRFSHIKGKKKGKMQVGDMGITFYDDNDMPLDSILYQVLRSWNSRPGKDVSLVMTTGDGEKEIVVKTTEGEEIAKQMEAKAKALAVQHKKNRADKKAEKKKKTEVVAEVVEEQEEEEEEIEIEDKPDEGLFGVGQSHLDAPGTVRMVVGDEELTFTRHDSEGLGKPLSIVPYDAIKSMEAADGFFKMVCVVDGKPDMDISLKSDAAAAIVEMVEPKKKIVDEKVAAEGGAEEEEAQDEEEAEAEDEEEEEEGDEVLKEVYEVEQVHFRGTRPVEVGVTKRGLVITDQGKQTGQYKYTSLESWYNVRGECLHVMVGNDGLVSDFIFNTLEGHSICSMLETYASELAAESLVILPAGTKRAGEETPEEEAKAEAEDAKTAKPGEASDIPGPALKKKMKAMMEKLKMSELKNTQYLDQIEEMKDTAANDLDDLRVTLTEQNAEMKKRYEDQFATLSEGGDIDAGLKKALDESNAKFDAAMKKKDEESAAALKKAEAAAAADLTKVQQELDDMKASGAAGETTQMQQEMQKRDQMIKRLGAGLKKAKETEKANNKKLAAARAKMQEQMVTVKKTLKEKDARIVALEKGAVKGAVAVEKAASGEATEAMTAANAKAQEQALADLKEDMEKKLEAKDEELQIATATLTAMKKAGGKGGGDKVLLTQLETENASLKASKAKLEGMVDKLKKNGGAAMEKLKEVGAEAAKSKKAMDAMKTQREKETKLVQRAMGELKNLRGQIAEKDKKIKALEAHKTKMMAAVGQMKEKQAKDIAMEKTKNEQLIKDARAQVLAESNKKIAALEETLETTTTALQAAEAKAAATDVQDKVDAMVVAVDTMKDAEGKIRERMVKLRSEVTDDIPKVINACQFTVDAIMQKYLKECGLRRKLFNELQELKGNIRVYCRARPIIKFEIDQGFTDIVVPGVEGGMELTDPETGAKKPNEFDRFFPPGTSQEKVYEETNPLVQSVCDGYNVCIFAYGQTGSGKTYTMMGIPADPGVNMRALNELFRLKSKNAGSIDYTIMLSFLEIYCEEINDLLVKHEDRKKMEIKQQNAKGGVYIPGLTEREVNDVGDVMRVMEMGTKNRAASATKMNAESSRSHCVLQVQVKGINANTGAETFGKLNMIDLAGSEKLKRSGVSGQAQKEAIAINTSLSALGDVINGLGGGKGKHVPFRNSKLTHLLSDSLMGQSKCLMFLNISPSSSNYSETTSSMLFGQRCRKVELGKAEKTVTKGKKKAAASD
eukprot:COSAG06_NODE_211_length_20166_cov_26.103752_2_plen_2350_part_00